jgi:glycosyltransferase involved in cell wall biosynthesis
LRVTLVSKACVVGAYQTKLEAIAAHDDVELSVVVPPYWRQGQQRLTLERAHVEGYRLIEAPVALNGRFHVHFYPTLPRILRRTRPHLLHMDEEPYNLATYLAVRAAEGLGARALFFTWQNLLRRYPPPFRWMERYVYRHVAGAIAGNQDAVEVLRAKGYAGPARVIPQFGVDPTLFAPRGDVPSDRSLVIGYAGRLVEAKGLDVLMAALDQFEAPWRLMICGTGPWEARLTAWAATRGWSGRLTLCGQVPSEAMPERLAQMDVLVLPSRTRPNWKEQFGRVLIEAMACEVPVVGSDSGEIPHVIGEAGLVVPEGDAEALRQALHGLRHPARRRALGQRGRERVLQSYTQAEIAAQTVAFYRHLLADDAGGQGPGA